MGLIKAASGAITSTLADEWKEYFYCDAIDEDILVTKGLKRIGGKSSNKHGEDNIITDGSHIAVADGQCILIVEDGKVLDVCADPGAYTYDTGTSPSVFGGKFLEGLSASVQEAWSRFQFGGQIGKDQRIYYINLKEIVGNKYGTASPIPFRVVDRNIGLDIDTAVRCNGEYSFEIVNPMALYTNVTGNVQSVYTRDKLASQMKSELLTAMQPAFARISELGIRYSALPAHTKEIADFLNEELSKTWTELRGIQIKSFGVNSVTISEEDEKTIKEYQRIAILRSPDMATVTLADAQAQAMKTAAGNENGAMMGFMGMGMAMQAGGGVNLNNLSSVQQQQQAMQQQQMQQQMQQPMQQQPVQQEPAPQQAVQQPTEQPVVGAVATGETPRKQWFCPNCGNKNEGNFCIQCGTKRPEGF